jgi:hypothetical protein
MDARSLMLPVVQGLNRGVSALTRAPGIGPLIGGSITDISYVGRKSGRRITTPVSYRRQGAQITIAVSMPGQKTWWRNFLGEGGPISLRLDGAQRDGHAVTQRDENGKVTVLVQLDDAG